MPSMTYQKMAVNNFKFTPRVPNSTCKNFMLDFLPTINFIVVDKFVDTFAKFKKTVFSSPAKYNSAFLSDFIFKYMSHDCGTQQSLAHAHDTITEILGFSDCGYESCEGIATLYGTFLKLEPTNWHKGDNAIEGTEFVSNIINNAHILQQYLFTLAHSKSNGCLDWYTPTMAITQPDALLKMTSILFYMILCMCNEMDCMDDLYEVENTSKWLQFLWGFWLQNSAKKLYPFINVENKIHFIRTDGVEVLTDTSQSKIWGSLETIKILYEMTDEEFTYFMSMYHASASKMPKFTMIVVEDLYGHQLRRMSSQVESQKKFDVVINDFDKFFKTANLKFSGSGDLLKETSKAERKKSNLVVMDENLKRMVDTLNEKKDSDTAISAISKKEKKTWQFKISEPDTASLEYCSKDMVQGDWEMLDSYYSGTFLGVISDCYRSMLLPYNTKRHLSFYGSYIMPAIAELEFNRQVSAKQINSLNDTVNDLRDKLNNKSATPTKSRDDKLKEYCDLTIANNEKTLNILQHENDVLREHIAYLESCIKDSDVITESSEAFKVLTTEEKCDCIKKSGKRIILVGGHKINDLETYTGDSVEQRYGEDLVKVRNSLKYNKNTYDYIFMNTRAISHSMFFGLKEDYKDSATRVCSVNVSNARLVVDVIYAELFGK